MKQLLLLLGCIINCSLHAQVITTIAGCGACPGIGDGGMAIVAQIGLPGTVVFDSHGNYYFTTGGQNRIRKVNASTGIITTYAGNGSHGFTGDGGAATAARIYGACWLAIDNSDNLYLSDPFFHRIRKIDASTGIINTIAGTGIGAYSGDGGPASSATFKGPGGFAVDPLGNILISDSNRIRKIDALTGIITHLAGTGSPSFAGDGGPAISAQLNAGYISLDFTGNIYVSDEGNRRVRKINSSGIISTVGGNGTSTYGGDGIPATSTGIYPIGIALDAVGNIYIAEPFADAVRMIDVGGFTHTIAGTGVGGFTGDGGPATSAQLNHPVWVTIGRCDGNLYICDQFNNRIRKVAFTTLSPACVCTPTVSILASPNDTVCAGTPVTFTATVSMGGTTHAYQWYKNGTVVSTAGGTYTYAPVNGDSIRCVVTTSGGACLSAAWANSNSIIMCVVDVAPVTGTASICIGQTTSLTSSTPGGTWSSSNTIIASVGSSTGVVTGHVGGVATISYTIPMGCYATQAVTVNSFPASVVISFVPDSSAFCPGDAIGLRASMAGGVWSVMHGNATLSGSTLTAVTPGTDTVVYIVSNACGTDTFSRGFIIRIPPPPPYGDLTVCVGDTIVLKDSLAGGTFSGGWPQVVYFFPDSCIVIGYVASTAIISYTAGNGCSSSVQVTVNPWPKDPLFYESLDLCIGTVKILTDTPAGGIWYSSDTTIATIGIDGRIIAKDTGRTFISYTTPPNGYGCTTIDTFIHDVILPNFTVGGTVTNVQCYGDANGKIELNKLGANVLCRYLWSNGAITPVVQNLAVGVYTVTVTDTNTNCIVKETFFVTQPDSLTITAEVKKDICQSGRGSITLNVSGGTSPYTYAWSNGKAIKDPDGLTAGSYSLLLKDVNGCSVNFSILVEDTCTGIVVYNGVSPNGDGLNDTWIIEGIQLYPASEVQVYDKWGDMVFSKAGYQNDWNGGQIPDGTYFYLIKLNTANVAGGKDTFTGSLLIKR